uniref:F5/8 type C domain-containing protein n=1 Tax=Oncorhynchus tshawytscha TaxID=74940 RepID=A0A8C8I8T7_ONCTS
MRTLLISLLCVLSGVEETLAVPSTREFYIAAVEIGWDYLYWGSADPVSEQRRRTKDPPQKYIKAVYREYTDSTYSVPKPTPTWAGIQGPVIHAQASDRVVVHFKNLASQPYSISPVGVSYWKQSEGAGYEDATSSQEKEDDAVAPGGYYKYVWDINPNDGPTLGDPECLTYSYSSQVDTVQDFNSGLIGALLICKSTAFTDNGVRKSREFILLFTVFDESKSWYGEVGSFRERFKKASARKQYHTINGYVNSTLPGLTMCQGRDHVFWHLIGMETSPEIHSIQFQDHTLQVMAHRKVTVEMTPMTFTTAEMKPSTQGKFLISCQIQEHRHAGMSAFFKVEDCPEPVTVPSPDVRQVQQSEDKEDYEYGDDMFETFVFKPGKDQAVGRSRGGKIKIWVHYIAAEEIIWDYAPHLSQGDSQLLSEYFPRGPHQLGHEYKKVVYVEYTDQTFTTRKSPVKRLLGPLLRGQVDEHFQVLFKNLASRPFNIYPNGLTKISPLRKTGNEGEKDLRSLAVPPNGTYGYMWKLTAEDGPLERDPQCLTRLYQSTINPERDVATGLVGPLLICKKDSMDTRGRLVGPDKVKQLMFAVFDENKSWNINDNIQKYSRDPSMVNPTDPDFYNSNVIYNVNGIMFNGQMIQLCKDDVTFWHLANVGTQSDFVSVYFTGNPFMRDNVYESVLTLFPMSGETVTMETELIGEWEISAFDSSLKSRGMSARYSVLSCNIDLLVDNEDLEYGLEDVLPDYVDQFFKPRSLRPRLQNRTVAVRVCKKQPISIGESGDHGSDNNVTFKAEDQRSICEVRYVTVLSADEEGNLLSQGGIPTDVLKQLEKDGEWKASETQEGGGLGGEQGGKRQRRQARVEGGEDGDGEEVEEEGLGREQGGNGRQRRQASLEGGESNKLAENCEEEVLKENAVSLEYDDYSEKDTGTTYMGTEDNLDLRTTDGHYRSYYIAAQEITWDYGIRKPHQLIKTRERRRGMRKFLTEYKKVVFRAYSERDFQIPVTRGELQEHLGLMGPIIKAEINDLLTVTFKNMASRPYSLHLHGVAGVAGVPGEAVQPGEVRVYTWRITRKQGPTAAEFDCKAGAYYSTQNKVKDLHSGLIGPLVICKPGTLHPQLNLQPNLQEYALLFHTFDETKSWYLDENIRQYCIPPCQARRDDPWFQLSNKFAAINGYVAETLPGLMVGQHQQVRWHLLNVGGDGEYHTAHFHGLPFSIHKEQEHRMGVYNLYPGVFGTVEMRPATVGTWMVECTVGEHQLAGMRAKLLVYNPRCIQPLGLRSGRIDDSQITASDHIGNWEARLARLELSGSVNAWMGTNQKSWIQVDLQRPTLLHGIQTQGARASLGLKDYFIVHFTLSYSLDQETWTNYKGNSTTPSYVSTLHIFNGNLDGSKVKENHLFPPILGRYIRLQPVTIQRNPALRMELLGCDLNSCSFPLGLQRRLVPDSSFRASSFLQTWRLSWSPALARLRQDGSANAWRPKVNNPHEWLQVDFLVMKRITGVVTQGAWSILTQMMVTEFSVTISDEGHSWSNVVDEESQREKMFLGNSEPDEEMLNLFDPPLFARFIRIHPRGWVNDIALRLEFVGCDTQQRL